MTRLRRTAVALIAGLVLGVVAGCSQMQPGPLPACVLPGQKPMLVAELFFGRGIAGRAPLTDAEWAGFAAAVIAHYFPDGFTVTDGEGEWRNPQTHAVARERTKVLLVAVEPRPDLGQRFSAVIESYRKRFNQISVGFLTTPACGSF